MGDVTGTMMTPEERKFIEESFRSLRDMVSPLPDSVKRIEARQVEIDERLRDKEIADAGKHATQDSALAEAARDLAGAFKSIKETRDELDNHKASHLGWIGAAVTGVVGILGVIFTVAKYLTGG